MRFTPEYNDYLQSLSLEDRERELDRAGYYRAGHGRPTTFDRPSRPGRPYDPNDSYSAAENMGSYMSEQAALGTQGLAGDGPSKADAPKTQAAIKRGMERFGISASRVRDLAKSAGVNVLDSDNDLDMIQALLKKEGGRTGPKSDIRINNRPQNQVRPDPRINNRPQNQAPRSYYINNRPQNQVPRDRYINNRPQNQVPRDRYINNRDPNQVPRDRYINKRDPDMSEEIIDRRINNRDQNQQRPDPRVKTRDPRPDKGKGRGERGVSTVDVYGDRDKGKGRGERGVSTVDVYGDRDRREQRRQRQERRNQAVARVRARREAKQNR